MEAGGDVEMRMVLDGSINLLFDTGYRDKSVLFVTSVKI